MIIQNEKEEKELDNLIFSFYNKRGYYEQTPSESA